MRLVMLVVLAVLGAATPAGAGSTIAVSSGELEPVAAGEARLLWGQTLDPGQVWTLEDLTYQLFVQDDAFKTALVLHIFVNTGTTPVGYHPGSWWRSAVSPAYGPGWQDPVNVSRPLRLYGSAYVGLVVINATPMTQYVYWSMIWSQEP